MNIMDYPAIRSTVIITAIVAPLLSANFARSDDTEVYIGLTANTDNVNPNVLFVIDTSDSMTTNVEITQEYDPSIDYDVPWWVDNDDDDCERDDRVFFDDDDDGVPDCDDDWFDADKLVCYPALGALGLPNGPAGANETGRYTDQIGAWRSNRDRWVDSRFDRSSRTYIECEDDKGVHGDSLGDPSWPTDRNGPWISSDPDDRRPPWESWDTYTLYSANYIRWYNFYGDTVYRERLEIVQDVTKELVDSVSEINIGLMRFDTQGGNFNPTHGNYWVDAQGGLVVYPMRDIDESGIRQQFKDAVDDLYATGFTPLAETLYEAMLYYRGGAVKYGKWQNGTASHQDSRNGDGYITPITYECSRNYIVFLSDGLPNTDNDADNEIRALLDNTSGLTLGSCWNGTGNPYDNCLNELSEYMYKTDSATSALGNDLVGTQNITTYTVGFNVDDDGILESAAEKGGGRYYPASTAQQLTSAFTQIIEDILRVNTTFTSPAVSVNAFNRLTHKNELYFTVFQPDDRPHWAGNVKKFKIELITDGQGQPVDADGDGEGDIAIFDANGNPAIDDATGFFKETSRSFWTLDDNAPDGDEAGEGGLAGRLYDYGNGQHVAASRENHVYTFTNSTDGGSLVTGLTHSANALHESNAFIPGSNDDGKITKAMLNVESISNENFLKVLSWARGLDVNDEDDDGETTDGRPIVGAPLHTRPFLVTYYADPSNDTQDDVLFVITNDGYLHMVPTNDPAGTTPSAGDKLENWTFMPPDKLHNLMTLFNNDEASNITYGIDGGMDLWINDLNGDFDLLKDNGDLDTQDGVTEHAYIYFGQRRGGTSYYALDVSDQDAPEYLWNVTSEGSSSSDPLSQLGQTWSRPRHTKIYFQKDGSTSLSPKDVIIVGGGYDQDQDNATTRGADEVGNAIFILDAITGAILWWAGDTPQSGGPVPDLTLSDMDYSIPADIRVVDINGDGVMDRFFASDMGGQIWRFDIDNEDAGTLASRISGGRIADLQKLNAQAGDPDAANNRRFYYPPDVALIIPDSGPAYHSIAIGSGFRAHPNDVVIDDRIYVLKDYDIDAPPTQYGTLYEEDLLDVTERNFAGLTDAQILDGKEGVFEGLSDAQEDQLENGWYISLTANGEKALATAITADSKVLITTFIPADQTATNLNDVCAPSQGVSRLYALNAKNGAPVANLDQQGKTTPEDFTFADRYYDLTRRGIAPEVTIIFPEDGNVSPIPIVGTELIPELKIDNDPESTYWYQENVH